MATKLKNKISFKILILFLSAASMLASFCFGSIAIMQLDSFGENSIKNSLNNKELSVFDSYDVQNEVVELTDAAYLVLSNGYTSFDEKAQKILWEQDDTGHIANAMWELNNNPHFKFYCKDVKTGKVLTNFDESDNIKTLLNDKKYAVQCVNGISSSTEAMPDRYDYFYVQEEFNWYFYFDFNETPDDEYYSENETSGSLITAINKALFFGKYDFKTYAILAVALALLSISLAIYYFTICGQKDENGKTKLLFLDYIPVDIHFMLSAVICIALGFLIVYSYDMMFSGGVALFMFKLAPIAIGACAGGIQLFLIELISSCVRLFKNRREWYKVSLITFLIYLLVKLIKVVHNFNKNNRKKIKEFLGYTPKAFQKRLTLFLVGYGFINIFFLILTAFWGVYAFESGNVLPAIGNGLCWFAMNVASVVFVSRYVVDLDKIISASQNRTEPDVNYDKLPNSLKILADSMKYTNQELSRAVDKAVKDERMRTELITNVSHDLKTPLTSIINYVDLLKACDIQDENAKEYIAVLDEKGIKLKRLIEDLLEASKVTSGVINLNPVNLNLSELATQATVESQQQFAENNLDLIFKGDKNNVFAFADGNKTYRVIENLLSNARKYSAKGSRVYADVYEMNDMAVFEIKNISAEPLDISADELKERFVRGDKSRTNEGNGLGLSIADNLCKAMNGRLDLIIDGDYFKAKVILPKSK